MADETAQAVAAALINEDVAAPVEGEQAAPEAPTETEAEPEFNYEADTEGIEDLLAEPDDEEDDVIDDDDEPIAAQTDEYGVVDPEVARLQAKLAKAQKQLKHQEGLRAKDNETKWRSEAERRFPLADVDEITATSRRGFMRKAEEQHQRYYKKVSPVLEKLDALRAEVITEAKAEGRQAAEDSWGKPTVAPQVAQVTAAEQELDPRRFKTLHDLTRARLKLGETSNVTATINDLIGQ